MKSLMHFPVVALAIVALACGPVSNDMKSSYIPRPEAPDEAVMGPETLLSLGRLSDPQLSPDGTRILYGMSYTDVAQDRSCRNLFVCNVDGTSRVQLTASGSSINCARWSTDGSAIYFLQDGQIWKAPFKGDRLGRREKLSDIPEGISEFKLSPDQAQVLYVSSVPGPVKSPADFDPALDKAKAYVTEDMMYRHWDHWVTSTPRTYVATLCNGLVTPEKSLDILGGEPYELPSEPFGGVEQLDWHPDGRHIAYSCRKKTGKEYAFSTDTEIYIYDILTGATVQIPMGGGYDTDPVWSPDGSLLAWISMPRDGYESDKQRLMVARVSFGQPSDGEGQCADVNIEEICDLTEGFDYDASGICWSPDMKYIYFNAMARATQKLFRTDLSGNVEQVSGEDWKYDFFSPFAVLPSDGGTKLLASYYCLNFPLELVSVDLAGSESSFRQLTDENGYILSRFEAPVSESVSLETVDGKQMQCWVLYPPKFDASKVYPAIEIVLGGPQGTNSQDWSYRWCYRMMAEQGYVVILPNRRGTTAFGQEWKEQISGDYSGLNMQDYLTAGRYIKSLPYVGKLACVGASYGGYSAYMLEGLHGDLYDCFIAHAGIFDEKQLWFTTEELWFANWDNGGLTPYAYTPGQTGPAGDGITFGGMQQAGAPYADTPKAVRHYANSPSSMVCNWHTPILFIHGMMDYRIPYEQGMAAFNAAQMQGVPSKLVVFPEENHWILKPQNALFWHRTFFEWLERWTR